jgi:hypothetical protein
MSAAEESSNRLIKAVGDPPHTKSLPNTETHRCQTFCDRPSSQNIITFYLLFQRHRLTTAWRGSWSMCKCRHIRVSTLHLWTVKCSLVPVIKQHRCWQAADSRRSLFPWWRDMLRQNGARRSGNYITGCDSLIVLDGVIDVALISRAAMYLSSLSLCGGSCKHRIWRTKSNR